MSIQQIAGVAYGLTPNAMNRDADWTIVVVDTSSGPYVELPSGCSIEDMVEVHYVNGFAPTALAPSGESIAGGSRSGPYMFRKIDTSLWSFV
jgi:hypothetical protein